MSNDTLVPNGRFDTRFMAQDFRSGVILSFISIAFGLGIAQISGFPLMAGLVSAIVAPIVISMWGGSFIVVCGSAAALAPILAHSVQTLGMGNDMLGYQRTLAVIIATGPIMYFIGHRKRAGWFAAFFSHSVIAGLLASIAVILLTSRISTFTGVKFHAHTFFGVLHEAFIEGRIVESNPQVLLVTAVVLGFLVLLTLLKKHVKLFQAYPPQFWAIPLLVVLAFAIPLEQQFRISIPADLTSFHQLPDFNLFGMWGDGVLGAFALAIITLTLVDTAESVATVRGIDGLDPYRRTSDVNRVVSGMGIANILSGFLGGLSNIPGGAKSTMSVMIGTKTAWGASVFCTVFVIIEVLLFRDFMNLMSQAGLAAIIVFTVLKMCSFSVWAKAWRAGMDQFAVFVTTFGLSILTGEILFGLIGGVLLQLAIVFYFSAKAANPHHQGGRLGTFQRFRTTLQVVWKLWWNPIYRIECQDSICDVWFEGVSVFFKPLDKLFAEIPHDASTVRFHVYGDRVLLIDQPTLERLERYVHGREGAEILHCDKLTPLSKHAGATRVRLQQDVPFAA